MQSRLKLAVKLSLAFMFFTAINNYTEVSAMAANRVIKVNNDDSKEIRIKEDDFITFVPQVKNKKGKQSYFYYSPENGKYIYQFGNGKYWINKKGLATVAISGMDRQGNLTFMAEYKLIIEKKAAPKVNVVSDKKPNANVGNNNGQGNAGNSNSNTGNNNNSNNNNSNNNSNNNNSRTILSNRGSALIDPATNTLVITDNTFVLQKFEKLIAELDVPARQVMVEARIVEAEDGFSRQLGVKFGYAGSNGKNSWGSNWTNALANRTSYVNGQRTLANWSRNPSQDIPALPAWTVDPNVNLPTAAATSSIALVHALSSGALGLELSAQQAQNKLKIVSTPRVLTQDRKEAIIEAGTEVPYQEASSSGATSTSFKKAVLGMTVTPNITPDGQIIMDIKINKDSVNSDCRATEPCINTQRLNTNVMVEDGGTLILGGIYQEENSEGVSKVPLLGDIPVVGNLFKSKTRSDKKTELLIFITPRIVDNIGSNLRY